MKSLESEFKGDLDYPVLWKITRKQLDDIYSDIHSDLYDGVDDGVELFIGNRVVPLRERLQEKLNEES